MAEFNKREARKANFLEKVFNGDQSTKASSFLRRKPTLMKKAKELETLCGIEVCIVCFDPNGNVDFWPNSVWEVKRMCCSYLGLNSRDKKELDYLGVLQSKKNKLIKQKANYNNNNVDSRIKDLWDWVDGLSGDSLRDSVNGLEIKIKGLKERIEFLKTRSATVTVDGDDKDWFCPVIDQNQSNELYQTSVQDNYVTQINMLGGENSDLSLSDCDQISTFYNVAQISQLPFNFTNHFASPTNFLF